MRDSNPKSTDALRIPQPKKKLGLSVPPALRLPHEDLIIPFVDPQHSSETTMPSQTSHSSQTSLTRHTPPDFVSITHTESSDISPKRDFSKVANSINREAVPAGYFAGKSKQLYDCLYSLTRGAIVPVRAIRISRPKLMKLAHIGSRVTFDTNIERLIGVGLVAVNKITGEHEGNEYLVFLPEEVDSSMPSQTSQTSHAQKLVRLVRLETSQTRHTSNQAESTTYEVSKTSFKTDDDDTHTVSDFLEAVIAAARSVVGGKLNKSEIERGRWKQLGDLLSDELRSAAEKAGPISSAPAFFEAHLRRKLIGKTANTSVESNALPDIERNARVKTENPLRTTSETPNAPTNGKSKFTIADCRRYAEHLQKTNQGIMNPGGYATTIHRTGEVDALIEKYLTQPSKQDATPPTACPDCNGTGYWYPQGKEKGVARCRHENLPRNDANENKGASDEAATPDNESDAP